MVVIPRTAAEAGACRFIRGRLGAGSRCGMEDSLYDEFGNYIGPELSDSGEDEGEEVPMGEGMDEEGLGGGAMDVSGGEEEEDGVEGGMAVVLHEDKKYYPSAEEVYGRDTETLVQEEDAQPLEVPIVAPVRTARIEVGVSGAGEPTPRYSPAFLASLQETPELARCVAVIGHLHHGKTLVRGCIVVCGGGNAGWVGGPGGFVGLDWLAWLG